MCAQNRAHIFGSLSHGEMHLSKVGLIAEAELRALHTHYGNIEVDTYVVMPNHIHVIIMIGGLHVFSPSVRPNTISCETSLLTPRAGSLSAIVRSYKAGVTRRVRELGLREAVWQSRFHDRLLRGDKVIAAVRKYIRTNPENWELDKENMSQNIHL